MTTVSAVGSEESGGDEQVVRLHADSFIRGRFQYRGLLFTINQGRLSGSKD